MIGPLSFLGNDNRAPRAQYAGAIFADIEGWRKVKAGRPNRENPCSGAVRV
jgi:hypothetical protein